MRGKDVGHLRVDPKSSNFILRQFCGSPDPIPPQNCYCPLFPTFKLTPEELHSFGGATFLDGIGSVTGLWSWGTLALFQTSDLSNFHSDSVKVGPTFAGSPECL